MSTRKARGPSRSVRGSGAKAIEAGRRAYMAGDFDAARETWLPLAEAGNAEAQAWIGSLHANGDGVALNDTEAFAWYLRAAEGGNVQAQSNVGAFYAMGQGVAKDETEAVRWTRRAAEGGDPNAQFNLAVFHAKGSGVPKDPAEAAAWYLKAAKGGHYPSQSRIGHMYVTGEGVERDRVQAFLWLSLAGQHGIGAALNALEGVVKQMSSDEKAEGMRLVDLWRGRTMATAGPARIDPRPA